MTDERPSPHRELQTLVTDILDHARQGLDQADALDLDEETESLLDAIQAAAHQSLALLDAPGAPAKGRELIALALSMRAQALRVADLATIVGHDAVAVTADLIAELAQESAALLRGPADLARPSQPVHAIGAREQAMPPPGTLLLVDSDDSHRETFATTLTGLGYAVIQARDSALVLAVNLRADVDLVLLDLGTAERDAYAVLKHRGAVPLLVVGAPEEGEQMVRCIQHGADDTLPVSADPILIRARIDAYVQLKRLRERALAHPSIAES